MSVCEKLDEGLANAIAIGMSPEEYWNGNIYTLFAYAKAYKIKKTKENEAMWLQGAYNMNAFGVVLANAFSKGSKVNYLDEPFEIFPKTQEEIDEENRVKNERFVKFLNGLKTNYDNKNK